MTRLRRRVWHWPLWLLIASAPGAIAQPDPQPPHTAIEVPTAIEVSTPIKVPTAIEVPTPIKVPTPNADSADTQPDSDLSASGPSSDVLSVDALSADALSVDARSADGLLREPAGPSSANGSNAGDDFKPSEEISEDFSISLPVDI
jgi:hypothetical protein